jgi:FkbM family methyltransferase
METLIDTPKHYGLVYDVGMHKGEDSAYYLQKGYVVIGFEADPDHIAFCERRFANEIESGTLTVIAGAIVDPNQIQKGQRQIGFYKNVDVSVWGTVSEQRARCNELLGARCRRVEVNIVDFTQCLRQYGVPHYMKIDIEGSEIICLQALRDFLNKPSYISIESDPTSFRELRAGIRLLRELNYTSFKAVQQKRICRAKRESAFSASQEPTLQSFPEGASGPFGEDIVGHWQNSRQLIRKYRLIALLYKIFGERSFLGSFMRRSVARKPSHSRRQNSSHVFESDKLRTFLAGFDLGWYDTHARHSSTDQRRIDALGSNLAVHLTHSGRAI